MENNGYGILALVLTPLLGAVGYLYREVRKSHSAEQYAAKVKECDDLRAIVNAHADRAFAQLAERNAEQRILVEKLAKLEAELAVRLGSSHGG